MKKIFRFLGALALTLLVLGGCSQGGQKSENGSAEKTAQTDSDKKDSGDKTTIEMLVPGYDSGYLKDELDGAVAKFEKENPDLTVKIIPAGWDELNSKIVQLYQAGQSPDILMMGSRSIRQFQEQGVLEDLDPYLTDDFLKDRIENVMDTAKVDGKQYAIPLVLSSRALYYRSDLLDKAPETWDELLATAQKVHDEHDIYGFAIPTDIGHGTDEMLNFIYQNGGKIIDDNGEFVINSPENIETAEYLTKFKDVIPNPVDTARDDQREMFANGDLAMFIDGGWSKEQVDEGADKYPYEVAELPAGTERAVTLVTDSYALSSISEHKDEAFKFIEFLGQEDQQRPISEAYNWLPVLKSEEDDERFQDDFMKPFLSILDAGIPEPQVPNWDTFNKAFMIAFQEILSGKKTPEEALNEAQQEVSK